MTITGTLVAEGIIPCLTAACQKDALARLVSGLARVRRLDVERVLKDVATRERLGPTMFPAGGYQIAVPHATSTGCSQLILGIGTSPEGLPWGPGERARVHVVFLIIGPPETHALYLRVLSRIARLCDTPGFVERVLAASTRQRLMEVFGEAESSLGPIVAPEGMPRFCVLGAGHGGMAMAGHLALIGCQVNLFNRSRERIDPVAARGGIDVTGQVEGFATLNRVTTDPAEALEDADVLMVVVPATGHAEITQLIAPYLKDGQIVVLNPGRTGGALEVAQILQRQNPRVRPYIAETQTLLYTARVTNPAQVHIHRIKNSVPLATLPAYQVADVLPVIRKALPQFVPGDNVLRTSLDNIAAVFHPAIMILNAGRIEDTHGNFEYYIEGVTPAIAAVLEAIDRERVNVAAALGIRVQTAREWLYLAYDAAGKTLLEAMRANTGYSGIMAPGTVQHRYISEDVPTSLIPIASLGDMFGVPTPTIDALIDLACVMHGVDYRAEGRTAERLGLAGMSLKDIRFLVIGAEPAASARSDPAPSETPQ